jgi:hypothetical protein
MDAAFRRRVIARVRIAMSTQYANPGTATRGIGAISRRDGSHLLPLTIIVI